MWDLLSGIGNTALMGWDLYSGLNSSSTADSYSNALASIAAQNQSISSDLWNHYATTTLPLESIQAEYAMDDLLALRNLQTSQRDYGIYSGMQDIALAQQLDPIVDSTQLNLITRLSEGEDVLADRYRSQASADVSKAYDNQTEQGLRQFQAYGMGPESGSFTNFIGQMNRDEALAQAGARTNATRTAEADALSRQADVANYSSGIPLSAQSYTSSVSPSSVYTGLNNSASQYQNLFNTYSTAANNQMYAVGKDASAAFDSFSSYWS